MVKYALKIFEKKLQLMLDISNCGGDKVGIEKFLGFCYHISVDCVYISEGSYLWKHNDAVIYFKGDLP